jgi:AcrR family transcriptional regulator
MLIIGERGIEELSLREVARRLGVSHQAPYKHFPSRDHLLAEVVESTGKRGCRTRRPVCLVDHAWTREHSANQRDHHAGAAPDRPGSDRVPHLAADRRGSPGRNRS